MMKDADFYNDLVCSDEFYDFTVTMFNVCKFKFPTFLYSETDQCWYSLDINKEIDGNPYVIRFRLLPIDGSDTDFKALFDVGVFENQHNRTGWTTKYDIGDGFYRNGVWTNK